MEASLKTKNSLISELQRELIKCKAELKQLAEEKEHSESPRLKPKTPQSRPVSHHQLLEKSLKQSKQLLYLAQENKELKLRERELERLFMSAKTKLDQTELKAGKLTKELDAVRKKLEEVEIACEYYKALRGKALRLLGFMTKPVEEKKALSMRFMELDDSNIPVIVDILKQSPYADTLDLEGNKITNAGVKVLCEYLKSFTCRVATVGLNWNEIGDDGAWTLVEAMMERDFQIENNIAKVSQLEAPQKLSRVNISFNHLPMHTALIKKTMHYLKRTQRESVVDMNITKKALFRASAKTVGQAFKVVNEAFAEIAEVKSLTAVLDRLHIEQHDMTPMQLEARKLEERTEYVAELKTRVDPVSPLRRGLTVSKPRTTAPPQSRHPANIPDLTSSLTKELNIPFLLSKRPAFPLSFIEKTIAAGLEVNSVDKNLDETLLMYAARTGNLKLVQLMIEKRAIIDLANVIFS